MMLADSANSAAARAGSVAVVVAEASAFAWELSAGRLMHP